MIEGAVYKDGLVAVRYYQPVPKYVKVGAKEYVCSVRRSVSLLFVPENEVQPLLDFVGGCCGGQRKVFSLCSREAYNIYLSGER